MFESVVVPPVGSRPRRGKDVDNRKSGDQRRCAGSALRRPALGCGCERNRHADAPYRAFIELAPYLTLATVGPDGVDCSPRGDAPGFVRILDEKTLLIPNRNGNNRIESLRNIVRDPRVAIHFLIPGCADSLRLKGPRSDIRRSDPDR
jgi:hypothetical protein